METPKNVCQLFPQPYPSAMCDSFNCKSRAKYFIGRADSPLNMCMKVCRSCAENLVRYIPDELRSLLDGEEPKPLTQEEINAEIALIEAELDATPKKRSRKGA